MTHLTIDREKCQGHGRCALIAPEFFDVDDAGMGVVLRDAAPADGLAAIRDAALSCPENAILLATEGIR